MGITTVVVCMWSRATLTEQSNEFSFAIRLKSDYTSISSVEEVRILKKVNSTKQSQISPRLSDLNLETPRRIIIVQCLRKKGEYDKAIADLNETIRLGSDDAAYYNNLAWLQATCPDEKYRKREGSSRECEKSLRTGWLVTIGVLLTR